MIGSILKELSEMVKTSKRGGFGVSVREAVMSQFQMLMELAQLGKQDVDVGKHLAGNRQGIGQDKEFMRQVQEGATKACGTGTWTMYIRRRFTMQLAGVYIGAEGCKTGAIVEEPLLCEDSVEEEILEEEGRIAQETGHGKQ